MEDGPVNMPLPAKPEPEPISRPSSTSTQGSAPHSLPNLLPSFSSLSTGTQATSSPQPRPVAIAPAMYPPGTSPASTHPNPGGSNGATVSLPVHILRFRIPHFIPTWRYLLPSAPSIGSPLLRFQTRVVVPAENHWLCRTGMKILVEPLI
ncbi:hypothetical protein B0T25DRAFT_219138 [Lasiosphaeria hispida]|uniref:Uncharacterized protein n=1 Tax=Lasiosphaeria hispida TaxID=260671 RepID=A0AAJ0HJ79_9PEZI|nr:hypothetical protein B0T25DRAFT_219138 [Lasiosphaeria hispida]